MIKSNIFRQPKDILLFSLFALLLFMGHRTGFITMLTLFCMLVTFVIPLNRYIDFQGILLIVFTICFTVIGILNGCVDSLSTAIAYFIPSVFFYCLGKYLVDKIDYKPQLLLVMIVIITIYLLEIYFSIFQKILSTGSIVNTSRLFYFGGNEGRQLTATLVGLGASLGFIGLPMFLLYKDKIEIRCLFLLLFFSSLITTIHLVNRTGLVICVCSLIITLIYFYRFDLSKILSGIIICSIIFLILVKLDIISVDVFNAYALRNEVDFATGGNRTVRWLEALHQLFISPFGWAENNGTTDYFVHNMWLDIAKVVGIIPFVTLLICTISSFRVLFKLIKLKKDVVVAMLLSLNICFFLSCFVEPVYGGLHFFLYVMLWGIQKQYLLTFCRK